MGRRTFCPFSWRPMKGSRAGGFLVESEEPRFKRKKSEGYCLGWRLRSGQGDSGFISQNIPSLSAVADLITAQALQVFEAAPETELRRRLHIFTDRWWSQEPKAVRVFLRGVENCLTYLEYPDPWRTSLKTNNPIERYLEEVRRRIIPMRHFNNDKSVNRIIYGIIAYVLNNQNQDRLINQFTQPS